MSAESHRSSRMEEFLENNSLEETIEVLDETLQVLVVHTEYSGLSDQLVQQYLTIRDLRNVFVDWYLKERP